MAVSSNSQGLFPVSISVGGVMKDVLTKLCRVGLTTLLIASGSSIAGAFPGGGTTDSPAILPPISSFPYTQNFDGETDEGWTTGIVSGSVNNWVRTTPLKTQIASAHSAPKAWITNAAVSYDNNHNAFVESPVFDFSGMLQDPTLEFWHNFSTEGFDGAVVEFSTDGGTTWRRADSTLGTGSNFTTANSFNWYNSPSTSGPLPPPRFSITSTNYSGHSSGWIKSTTLLSGTMGFSDVRLRWRFVSDGTAVDEGWAFDDIRIGEDIAAPTISYTSLTNTTSTSNRVLNSFATITDASGVNTSGGTQPRIYYKKSTDANAFVGNTSGDNGWKYTETSNSSSPFDFTIDYSLLYGGSGVGLNDVIQYFVVAQDVATPPNVGANPSDGFTATSVGSIASAPSPNSYQIADEPLNGDYLIVGLEAFSRALGRTITTQNRMRTVPSSVPPSMPPPLKNSKAGAGTRANHLIEQEQTVEEYALLSENGKTYTGPTSVQLHQGSLPDGPLLTSYPTLTAAAQDLSQRGVSGPVRFLIESSYPGGASETFPITIASVAGTSSTNTVTIKPNTGVTVSIAGSASSNAIIKVFNSHYIIIDGSNTDNGTTRDLTIVNTGTTNPSVVWFGSSGTTPVTHGVVKNCILRNGTIGSSAAVVVSDGTTKGAPGHFSNMTIQNNSIQKALNGIYATGGSNPQNGSNLTCTQNDLSTTGTDAIGYVGIYLQGVNGALIANNVIGNFDGTIPEDDIGVWLGEGTINATVSSNRIHSLNFLGNDGYGGHGIMVTSEQSDCNNVVANNMIYNLSGDGYDYTSEYFTDNPYGIFASGIQTGVKLYFNSIYLSGNTLNQTDAISAGIALGEGTQADVRNNLIVNNLGILSDGYGSLGIWLQDDVSQLAASDHNNYVVNASGDGVNVIGQISTTPATSLDDWRSATGKDVNSVSGDPSFVSSTDLHIHSSSVSSWNVNGRGIAIDAVATDFDGNTRSTTVGTPTDIGADEFTPALGPPLATMSGTIGDGQTTTFTSAGRIIGSIVWHEGGGETPSTLPTSVSLTYYPGVPPPGTTQGTNANSYWTITTDGGENFTYDLTFNYTMAEIGAIAEDDLTIAQRNSPNYWALLATSPPNTTAKTVTALGLDSFSDFTLTSAEDPLPVTLTSFTGQLLPNGRSVRLDWVTTSEVNNFGFYVQRRAENEQVFTEIPGSFIPGHGTTLEPQYYSYTDTTVHSAGVYHYRLRQVEFDGTSHFTYSISINVTLLSVEELAPREFRLFQNYPNPFNPSTELKFSVETTGRATLRIYNTLGQEVATLFDAVAEAGRYYKVKLNASNLASGVYFYRLQANDKSHLRKMLLVK
jgi:hypothetical protein